MPRAGGFTLIEAALTTVIVGTGVLAIVAAQQAYHQKNTWAQRAGTAQLLANEVREMTLSLPIHDPITGDMHIGAEPNEPGVADFDDLDDFTGPIDGSGGSTGVTFSPAINALRQPIDNMPGWSQHIEVGSVFPDWINATTTQPVGATDTIRVVVRVLYQAPDEAGPSEVTSLAWLVTR